MHHYGEDGSSLGRVLRAMLTDTGRKIMALFIISPPLALMYLSYYFSLRYSFDLGSTRVLNTTDYTSGYNQGYNDGWEANACFYSSTPTSECQVYDPQPRDTHGKLNLVDLTLIYSAVSSIVTLVLIYIIVKLFSVGRHQPAPEELAPLREEGVVSPATASSLP